MIKVLPRNASPLGCEIFDSFLKFRYIFPYFKIDSSLCIEKKFTRRFYQCSNRSIYRQFGPEAKRLFKLFNTLHLSLQTKARLIKKKKEKTSRQIENYPPKEHTNSSIWCTSPYVIIRALNTIPYLSAGQSAFLWLPISGKTDIVTHNFTQTNQRTNQTGRSIVLQKLKFTPM